MLALTAAEGTTIVSATGGVILAALVAFGIWWFRPFRSASRQDVGTLDQSEGADERERQAAHREDGL